MLRLRLKGTFHSIADHTPTDYFTPHIPLQSPHLRNLPALFHRKTTVQDRSLPSRKQQHVELCVNDDVTFRAKTTGLERYELEYDALPEIDLVDVATDISFFGHPCSMPVMITGMTGGYADAERINAMLGEVCDELRIPMGLGSIRAAMADEAQLPTYASAARAHRTFPMVANVGAAQIADWKTIEPRLMHVLDALGADVVAVHLNPLQELLQPEGEPRFRGVLDGIAALIRATDRPVIVKEVGAGISGAVARRLVDIGVHGIDVAGAGGTSWAGVEILRRDDGQSVDHLWDVGIPTAECVREVASVLSTSTPRPLLIASGGIMSGTDVAKCIALGADCCGMARPVISAIMNEGVTGAIALLRTLELHLRQWMFLTGSATIADLHRARLRTSA